MPHDPGRIAERRPGRVLVDLDSAAIPLGRRSRGRSARCSIATGPRRARGRPSFPEGGRGTDELAPKGIAVVPSAAHEDAASGVVG